MNARTGAQQFVVGTAQLSARYGIGNRTGPPEEEEALAMLIAAAEARVGGFDTAPSYGTAESLLGRARVSTPVFTKLAPGSTPVESVERSLERLRRDQIDILFLHQPSILQSDPDGVIDQAHALVGRFVKTLGASVYTPTQFAAAIKDPRINAIQAPLSVADRRLIPEALSEAAGTNTAVYARSVFLQGALLLAPTELPAYLRSLATIVQAVNEIGTRTGRHTTEILLAFVRDLAGISGTIVGCESLAQLSRNLEAICSPALEPADRRWLLSLPELPVSAIDPREWSVGR